MAENSESNDLSRPIEIDEISSGGEKSLCGALRGIAAGILSPDGDDSPPLTLAKRIRKSWGRHGLHLREASGKSANDLLRWTREGSPLRALLVILVGAIMLLALTGLLVFTLFFLAATLNAIIISALMSVAAVGGFLALFFVCLTTVYIGALLVAFFVISATTISAIVAVVVAAGWVGFFCVVWLATKKSTDLIKQSFSITSSAISAYSASYQAQYDASLNSPLVKVK